MDRAPAKRRGGDGDKDNGKRELEQWEARRQWRSIGQGLAQEESSIQLLYHPEKVYAPKAAVIVFCVLFAAAVYANVKLDLVGEIMGLIGLDRRVSPFSAGYWQSHAQKSLISQALGLTFVCVELLFLFGVSFLLGHPLGRVLARLRSRSLPRPPDDGYGE